MSFIAAYDGRCGLCDGPIYEGDEVEFFYDEVCHCECVEDERTDSDDGTE
jgi:hypothetical protein